jgi:monoamine oxidase
LNLFLFCHELSISLFMHFGFGGFVTLCTTLLALNLFQVMSSFDSVNTVVVVGGGLSGLTAARDLEKACSRDNLPIKIIIVEARERFGGRIHSEHGVDLGATWTWPAHDVALGRLAAELKVSVEEQYAAGNALVQKGYGRVVPFARDESPAGGGSMRFKGGTSAIISVLIEELRATGNVELVTSAAVQSISTPVDGSLGCSVTTYNPVSKSDISTISAQAVIVAMPLRLLANSVRFDPALPSEQAALMSGTPTWMADTGKIGFVYEKRFWVDQDNSGTAFSETGPMSQLWDASAADGGTFALSSFVFGDALDVLSDPTAALAKDSAVMRQLVQLFGPLAASPKHIIHKAWSLDPFTVPLTCSAGDTTPLGHPEARRTHHNIVFAGTESCPYENGHMNGAVLAGLRAAKDLLSLLRKKF